LFAIRKTGRATALLVISKFNHF